MSYLLWAFSFNFTIFVLARFIGGISKGNISLSMAIITDVTSAKERGKAMVYIEGFNERTDAKVNIVRN